ncbi:MAG: hypothetical protein LBQ54_14200 [Planctomycetaceae bacterium]|jgi:hypothetical protein|nr:hypothetical protein [Planctomycetaceae bacterium]
MAPTLKAGSVAIEILGIDKDVEAAIKRTQTGFSGLAAHLRDSFVTLSSIRTTN